MEWGRRDTKGVDTDCTVGLDITVSQYVVEALSFDISQNRHKKENQDGSYILYAGNHNLCGYHFVGRFEESQMVKKLSKFINEIIEGDAIEVM